MTSVRLRRKRTDARPSLFGAGAGQPVDRRYVFRAPFVYYVGVTVFIAIGAFNSQNNLLFIVFGLAAAGLIVSGVVSGAALTGLRVSRRITGADPDLPGGDAAVGGWLLVEYRVTNRNSFFPAFALTIAEAPDRDAADEGRLRVPPAFAHHVGPGQTLSVRHALPAAARGRATLRRVVVSSSFPFGLVRKVLTFDLEQPALIRPAALPLRESLLAGLAPRGGGAGAASRRFGTGEDFAGLREYVGGEDPRDIAWRPSARLGRLVVRQRAVRTPARVWIELPATHADPQTRETAIAVAAALASEADRRGLAFGLVLPGLEPIQPRTGRIHLDRAIRELAALDDLAAEPRPAAPLPGDARFVVAAGAITPTSEAVQISVSDPQTWLAPGAELPPVLLPAVGMPADGAAPRRRAGVRGLGRIPRRGRT